jgi:cell division protein FtsB
MSRISIQVVGIIVLVLLLFIGWDFSQRLTLMARLRQNEQELDQRLAQAQATRTALQEQKNRALTDAFVEDWVRRKMHYIRDGETLVIPQITPAPIPPSAALPAQGDGNPSDAPPSNWWQELIEFLFGP